MLVFVEGVGLCGPGLAGWARSRPVLADTEEHAPAPTSLPGTLLLPANERRRAVETVKLALAVGEEAFAGAGRDPAETATVFTSSGGDGATIHAILSVLASPNRELSPTRFHNSVHNTPAGYWGLATRSRAPSASLCCHDASFAAGLLEAVVETSVAREPVALIAYDVQYPAPLSDVRPIGAAFAVALVLAPVATRAAFARLELRLEAIPGAASTMRSSTLEAVRQTTPAARSLPLLAALASRKKTAVTIDYLEDLALALEIGPAESAPGPGAARVPLQEFTR